MEDYKKKYEEALESLKKIRNANENNKELVDFIEYKYPELKDSDERIRKEILEYFQQFENEELRGVNISDWIAWLEKQKDHEDELEKAYKTADEVQYRKGFEDGVASVKPVEWSEDGEMMINTIIYDLERHGGKEDSNYSAEINWLKSLKERYIWKPSEEQTNALYNIVSGNLKDACRTKDDVLLEQLLNDLMKLKGE